MAPRVPGSKGRLKGHFNAAALCPRPGGDGAVWGAHSREVKAPGDHNRGVFGLGNLPRTSGAITVLQCAFGPRK